MQDRLVFGVILVNDIDGEPGLAGWLEGVGAVEVGVVVADQVVETIILVHGPLGGGTEAGGAVEGVACWGGDDGGCFDGGCCDGGCFDGCCFDGLETWDEEGEVEDKAENVCEHVVLLLADRLVSL